MRNGARTGSATGYQGRNLVQWGKGRVRDWTPRYVLDKMKPGQGEGHDTKAGIRPEQSEGLGSKAGVGRNRAKAGSWTVYQGPYWTKWDQDRVRDWVQSLNWNDTGPRQGQGLGAKAGIG